MGLSAALAFALLAWLAGGTLWLASEVFVEARTSLVYVEGSLDLRLNSIAKEYSEELRAISRQRGSVLTQTIEITQKNYAPEVQSQVPALPLDRPTWPRSAPYGQCRSLDPEPNVGRVMMCTFEAPDVMSPASFLGAVRGRGSEDKTIQILQDIEQRPREVSLLISSPDPGFQQSSFEIRVEVHLQLPAYGVDTNFRSPAAAP